VRFALAGTVFASLNANVVRLACVVNTPALVHDSGILGTTSHPSTVVVSTQHYLSTWANAERKRPG
jgi:hypothetical protein